jgi:hypothetical protein
MYSINLVLSRHVVDKYVCLAIDFGTSVLLRNTTYFIVRQMSVTQGLKDQKDDYRVPRMGTGDNFDSLVLSPYEIYKWIMDMRFNNCVIPQKYISWISRELKLSTLETDDSFRHQVAVIWRKFDRHSGDHRVHEIINTGHRRFMLLTDSFTKNKKKNKNWEKHVALQKKEWLRVLQVRENIPNYLHNREMWNVLICRIKEVYHDIPLFYGPITKEEDMVSVIAIHKVDQEDLTWNRLLLLNREEEAAPLITVTYRSHLLSRPIRLPIIHIEHQIDYDRLHTLSVTIAKDPFLVVGNSPVYDKEGVILRFLRPITLQFEFYLQSIDARNRTSASMFCGTDICILSPPGCSIDHSWPLRLLVDDEEEVDDSIDVISIGCFELQLDDLLKQLNAAIFRMAEIKRLLPSWIKSLPVTIFPIICSFLPLA